MSYTRGELVSAALEEIGIAEYEFDISPGQRQSAIRRLDMMLAEWTTRGITLPYPITKEENAAPDEDSQLPDWAWEPVVTNLAVRLAPSYGKAVSPDTKAMAKRGYTSLCSKFACHREMQFDQMPKGAGYKSIDQPFTPEPGDPYLKDDDNSVDLTGGPV